MVKVVYNIESTGLNLSEKASKMLAERTFEGCNFENDRTNPYLIEVVETLGREACDEGLLVVEEFDDSIYDFKIISGWDDYNDCSVEEVSSYRNVSYVKELMEKGDLQGIIDYFDNIM